MNKFIIMQRLVCFLLVWNIALTGCLIFNHACKQADKLNEQICALEEIPNDNNVPEFDIVEGF